MAFRVDPTYEALIAELMNLCVVKWYVSNARTVNMTRLTAFAAECEQYLSIKKKKRRAIRTLLRSRETLGEYATTVRQMYQDATAGTSSSPSV